MASVVFDFVQTGKAYTSRAEFNRLSSESAVRSPVDLASHVTDLSAEKVTPQWEADLCDLLVSTAGHKSYDAASPLHLAAVSAANPTWSATRLAGFGSAMHLATQECRWLREILEQSDIHHLLSKPPFQQADGQNPGELSVIAAWIRTRCVALLMDSSGTPHTPVLLQPASTALRVADFKHQAFLITAYAHGRQSADFVGALGVPLDRTQEETPPNCDHAIYFTASAEPGHKFSLKLTFELAIGPAGVWHSVPGGSLTVNGHPTVGVRYVKYGSDQQVPALALAYANQVQQEMAAQNSRYNAQAAAMQNALQASNAKIRELESSRDGEPAPAAADQLQLLASQLPPNWVTNPGAHAAALQRLASMAAGQPASQGPGNTASPAGSSQAFVMPNPLAGFSPAATPANLQVDQVKGLAKLPVFGDFNGQEGMPAVHWITDVERYFQFGLAGFRGQEVTFTLAKLKGNASDWFKATLGRVYGVSGVGCPAAEFIAAFKARYITPECSLNARSRLVNLNQGNSDIRTFNEKFIACIQDLELIPGDDGLSDSSMIELYLRAINGSIRTKMAQQAPELHLQTLDFLQSLAVQCDHTYSLLKSYSEPKSAKAVAFEAGVPAAKSPQLRSRRLTKQKAQKMLTSQCALHYRVIHCRQHTIGRCLQRCRSSTTMALMSRCSRPRTGNSGPHLKAIQRLTRS